MEIKDLTQEQINRLTEIRDVLERYSRESVSRSVPVPSIPIDERMLCEWYFTEMDQSGEAEKPSASDFT